MGLNEIDLTKLPNVDPRLIPVLSEYLRRLAETERKDNLYPAFEELTKALSDGNVAFLVSSEMPAIGKMRAVGINFLEINVFSTKNIDLGTVAHEIEHWFDKLWMPQFIREAMAEIGAFYTIYGDEEKAKQELQKLTKHPYHPRVMFLLTICEAAGKSLKELINANRKGDIKFFNKLLPKQYIEAIKQLESDIYEGETNGEKKTITVEVSLLYDVISDLRDYMLENPDLYPNFTEESPGIWALLEGYNDFLEEQSRCEFAINDEFGVANGLDSLNIQEIICAMPPNLQYVRKEDIELLIYRMAVGRFRKYT